MKKVASILRFDFVPASVDLGLLLLRLWFAGSLVVLHGWSKLMGFQKMAGGFFDPLRIGHRNSLILAIIGEVVCPVLIILGVFTRFGALGSAINMSVAFIFVHKTVLKGPGSGEMAFIYLGAFLTILVAGAGRFSVDGKRGGGKSAVRKPKPPLE